MIYLIDDATLPVPQDCTYKVFTGDITQMLSDMSGFELLEPEEQVMLEQGPKIQYWHHRNQDKDFRVLTQKPERYFNYVAKRRFVLPIY